MASVVDVQLFYEIIGTKMSTELPLPPPSQTQDQAIRRLIEENLGVEFRDFFQSYTGISRDNQIDHIIGVVSISLICRIHFADKVPQQSTFPDLFAWSGTNDLHLLNYNIRQHPRYAYLLGQLRTFSTFNPPALLVIGTTFGQDLRYLVNDGIPAAKLYGCFLRSELFQASTQLFCDAALFPATHSIRADATAGESNSPLYQTAGSWTAISSNNYLNRFDLETQEQVAHTMLSLLRQDEGSILLGSVIGIENQGILDPVNISGSPYQHTAASLRAMWERVQNQSGLNLYIEIEEANEEATSSMTHFTPAKRLFFFVEIQPQSQQSEWRVFG